MIMNMILIKYNNLESESKVRVRIRDKYNYNVVPTPREISVKCGISHILENNSNFNEVLNIIAELIKNKDIDCNEVEFFTYDGESYNSIDDEIKNRII